MSQTKTLAELTIKNNFLFSAVMLDPENCRGLLEIILGTVSYTHLDVYKRQQRNSVSCSPAPPEA